MASEEILNPEIKKEDIRKVYPFAVPSSVYRLQFNKDFTFEQASRLVSYLRDLGIDFIYSSPYFQSTPGSLHGYNITNPHRINPEIGTEEQFSEFCETIKRNGLGQIMDVVPNHMGITGNQNDWWQDVLENGPSSIYSEFFDIDWQPVKKETEDKVLLPILGDHYGIVLENQEIQLAYENGQFVIKYFDHLFPVNPGTYPFVLAYQIDTLQSQLPKDDANLLEYLSVINAFQQLPSYHERDKEAKLLRHREKEIAKKRLVTLYHRSSEIRSFLETRIQLMNGKKGEASSFDILERLLNNQPYRLAFWRVASEEINYRRFFDINELAALRVEDLDVFIHYHKRIFELIREGKVQGLRIDHPDGLYDPPEYFRRLQSFYLFNKKISDGVISLVNDEEKIKEQWEKFDQENFVPEAPLLAVAEKILERKESLPQNWILHGTVGYEYLNALNGLFVRRENEKALTEFYEKFIGYSIDFNQLLYEKKKIFALIYMASEINSLGHHLDLISERHRKYRDFTRNNLTLAIREVIACFPVYRTYITPRTETISERDQKYMKIAIEKAKQKTPALNPAVYDFLKKILLFQWEENLDEETKKLYRDFVMHFQQITGPVMAKGLEDTVFYIYNRLISLNEVGADPAHFGFTPDEFHRQNIERHKDWPYSLIASSTHDTKRSEDVRMRIHVISEIPDEWRTFIEKASILNQKYKTLIGDTLEPRRNMEYFIYQTLLGVWSEEKLPEAEYSVFCERIWSVSLKSVREAKLQTSWASPNAEYEDALKKFIFGILDRNGENRFIEEFLNFRKKVAAAGVWNSLSALVLKMGSPGIVDTYQGCELWTDSLVDPDNRRAVDYELRKKYLESLQKLERTEKDLSEIISKLRQARTEGRLKLYLLFKSLHFRKINPDLFLEGDYVPLKIEGPRKDNLVAFARMSGNKILIVAAGRFFMDLISDEIQEPVGAEIWADTKILLPKDWNRERTVTDIFTGETISSYQEEENKFFKVEEIFRHLSAGFLAS